MQTASQRAKAIRDVLMSISSSACSTYSSKSMKKMRTTLIKGNIEADTHDISFQLVDWPNIRIVLAMVYPLIPPVHASEVTKKYQM